MTGRTPACEDAAAISERLRQIQRDRMAAIAGCSCPQRDVAGEIVHTPICPLRAPPSQMVATLEAMQRARARVYRRAAPGTPPLTADEIIERGIAEKYARHRIYTRAETPRPGSELDAAFDRAIAATDRAIAAAKRMTEEIERAIAATNARHRVLS